MVNKQILPNGVRILTERLDHVRSCAVGIWVESGSRHEPAELSGISHFLEHMLFKGTDTRDAGALAEEFDAIGGQVNAFTTKEHTCYYARTLDTHVRRAAELLCDMYFRSVFREEDARLERGVILEEIGMYEDTPEDLCGELLSAAVYPDSSLGRPILGTRETLEGIGHRQLSDYCRRNYAPGNTIVTLCGSFSDDDLRYVADQFAAMHAGTPPVLPAAPYTRAAVLRKKDIEQNHLIVAFPCPALGAPERFTLQALNNILGAGMSSRLYQRVREQAGLCYNLYSYTSLYLGAGVLGVYVALSRSTERQALSLIRDELVRFRGQGVTEAELSRTKEQLKAGLLMGLESTISRMSSMARSEMLYGTEVPVEELVAGLEAVTCADVRDLAQTVLDFGQMSFSAVGSVAKEEEYLGIFR